MATATQIISVTFDKGAFIYMGTPVSETDKAVKFELESYAATVGDKSGRKVGYTWLPKSVLIERFSGLYEVKKSFQDKIKIN